MLVLLFYAMLSRMFGQPVVRQPLASMRKGEFITPTKPKKQPVSLTPNKSAGRAKQPLVISGEMPMGPAAKKARKSSIKNPAVGGNVGSVHESDETHWKQHSGDPSSSSCCRCFYIRRKAELRREFPWLGPRPTHMGGHWRLGCDVCHWMRSNKKKEIHQGRRGSNERASVFAGFNFLRNAAAGIIRDRLNHHRCEEGHKIAVGASHQLAKALPASTVAATETIQPLADNVSQPLAGNMAEECIAAAAAQVLGDNALLKGHVPQVQEWLDAWAESTEQIAFRKQARLAGKRLVRTRRNLRQVRRKQLKVMAECRRRHIRQMLRKAQFISLSMDERKYQKIVRFRCDAPREPYVHRGILGVMALERSAVGEFEEDHALVGVRKIDAFLNTFCTPLVKANQPLAVDIELKDHILKCTRALAADGASKERRALLLAAEEVFPNIVVLIRDAAHILRIAVRDPLHLDDLYGEVWTELFDKRHALVPDVMNSKKWQDLLQNIQKDLLRISGEDQPLAVLLKHLSFAKQRFESSADPMAKVAFLLLPLATMLALIASDDRLNVCERNRAKDQLKKMTSKFALAVGASADWGLVTLAFIGLFDKNAHDIAKTKSEIELFKKVMRILFGEGRIFYSRGTSQNIRPTNLPAIGGYFGVVGVKPMFVTRSIQKTIRKQVIFNCGTEQVLLWGQPSISDVEEVVDRMKLAAQQAIRRVDAEFDHLKIWDAFHVPAVVGAFTCSDVAEARKQKEGLERCICSIAESLGLDKKKGVREYRLAAKAIVKTTKAGQPLATATNNDVWKSLLNPALRWSNEDEPQNHNLRVLNLLIRLYISIEDGECPVERDLAALCAFNDEHCNVDRDLADDLLLLKTAPIEVGDICPEKPTGAEADVSLWRPGPVAREWAQLWREMYGARLGCYSIRTCGKAKVPGSYNAARRGVLAAAEYAVASKMQNKGEDPPDTCDVLEDLGVSKSFLESALGDRGEKYKNTGLQRFAALTEKKKLTTGLFMGRHLKAQRKWQPSRGARYPKGLEGGLGGVMKVCFLGEFAQKLPQSAIGDGQPGIAEVSGRNRCHHADLVVLDDLTRVCTCADVGSLHHTLAISALGLPVITRASWVLAQGRVVQVPAGNVVRHVPLLGKIKVVFEYDKIFYTRYGLLVDGLKLLSRREKSTWKVRQSSDSAVGEKGYEIVSLVADAGVGTLRAWVLKERKIANTIGSKAWTVDNPIF